MDLGPRPVDKYVTNAGQPEFRPVGVPLSPGSYRPVNGDKDRYTTLIRGRVESLLRDETLYAERQSRIGSFLHAGEWKQVKKEKNLTFYRRFERGRSLRELALEEELPEIQRAVERGYTSMICDGFVDGTIEDMMYGMTASSQDDLMTGFSYKDPPKDCVWLGTIESPTREDPFHTADLIWALPKLPSIFDQLDVCYLKATGVQLDVQEKRYGYLILHSVYIGQCPSFAAHGISRAKMYFACLFREPRPGVLKVTVRGIIDLSKKVRLLKSLISASTTSVMVGLFNGVKIGEAKKLTLLALRNRFHSTHTFRQTTCYMCCKRASFLGRANLFGTHLLTCYVCGDTVCNNCTRGMKQRVFLGEKQACSKVDCCPNCVLEATTTIHVRPNESEYLVVAEMYRKQRSTMVAEIDTNGAHHNGMKTNNSAGVPTASTEGSVGEFQLDFEDDAFSAALSLPMLRKSSEEDNEPESSPEVKTTSVLSEIKPWSYRIELDEDDFIPSSSADRLYNVMQFERRQLELNLQTQKPSSNKEQR
ncbi:hypothetical protein Plhal304r1_c012g0045861 [Plasmopara halstedii]